MITINVFLYDEKSCTLSGILLLSGVYSKSSGPCIFKRQVMVSTLTSGMLVMILNKMPCITEVIICSATNLCMLINSLTSGEMWLICEGNISVVNILSVSHEIILIVQDQVDDNFAHNKSAQLS